MKKIVLSILISSILLACIIPLSVTAAEPVVHQEETSEGSIDSMATEISSAPAIQETTEPAISTEKDAQHVDYAFVSAALSAVTAVVAIVAPIVSNMINAKSNEKLKYLELHSPKVYTAVSQMIASYSNTPRYLDYAVEDSDPEKHYWKVRESFNHFRSSCYEVMALVPNIEIHQQILNFVNLMEQNLDYNIPELERAFQELITAITLETSPNKSKAKNPHIPCKDKRTDTK